MSSVKTDCKDKSNPKVSVIIPVWNPGPGISRCIESLRNQTLSDIEMLFIDDCGNDNSMDKVRTAADDDPRIRIIKNEKNIGAGPSRNRGIEAARGEYLSFVDPDDYLAPDFLSLLYTEGRKGSFDIIKGSLVRVRENGTVLADDRKQNQSISDKLLAGIPLYNSFTYAHQTAIYRRDYLISRNAFYGTSARGEDTTFLLKACSQTKSFSLVDGACYYFCGRSDSAMQSMDDVKLQACLHSLRDQIQYIATSLPDNPDTRQYIKKVYLNGIREYARYDDAQSMKEKARLYLEELREELMDHPFYEDLIKDSFSLRVLCDYGVGLPMTPCFSPWEGINPPVRYARLVKRWVDFYLNTPTESEASRRDLAKLIVDASKAVDGKHYTMYSAKDREMGKIILNEQMERLPRALRYRIEILKARSKAKNAVASVLPKPLKRKIRTVLIRKKARE